MDQDTIRIPTDLQTTLVHTPLEHVELTTHTLDAADPRYQPGDKLGAGGFGEVRLCKDTWIARHVAMKVLHQEMSVRPDMQARFLREARVQGQLEHPSIVPVYDVGLTQDGAPFFTMKRVHGVDLYTILWGLRHGDAEAIRRFSRHRLLTALSSICLTIDFAHQRGVVHRDLKPANVMLGDFGEVYVLDWGVAKIMDLPEIAAEGSGIEVRGDLDSRTQTGAILGTPTYMAPEQQAGQADARSDVYALGALLVEILTFEPPDPSRADDPFAGRDIPPELMAAARRATQVDPALRFASARELADAIDRYLEGDRDLELRRRLAVEHVRLGEDALVKHDRRRASQEVGRALGLDPSNAAALKMLVMLLTDLPRETPPEAERAIAEAEEESARASARTGFFAMLASLVLIPGALWLGVRSWLALAACVIPVLLALGFMAVRGWRPGMLARPGQGLSFVLLACFGAALSSSMGIFGAAPVFVAATTMSFMMLRSSRPWVTAVGCLSILGPLFLEWAGAVPSSYAYDAGTIRILPRMHELPPTAIAIPVFFTIAVIVAGALFSGKYRDNLRDAERRLQLQAWQLRQLVPAEPRNPRS